MKYQGEIRCEDLYKQYVEISQKNSGAGHQMMSGDKIRVDSLSLELIEEHHILEEKLKECLPNLTHDQLVSLTSDDFLSDEAGKELMKRQ